MEENKNVIEKEKQDKDRKYFAIVAIILFTLVVASPWILSMAFGDNAASEEEGGLTEKRELTAFPTTLSDDWFSRFEAFYNDHSPYRNNIISYETTISQKYETYYRNKINPKLTELIIKNDGVGSNNGDGSSGPAEPTPMPTIDMNDFNDLFGNSTPTPTPADIPSTDDVSDPTEETPAVSDPSPTVSGDNVTSSPTPADTGSAATPDESTSAPAPTPTPTQSGATAHTHAYDSGTVTRNATCTQEGERKYTCKTCGNVKTEKIPVTNHKYTVIRTQKASAERYGYRLSKCSACGYYNLDNVENKTTSTAYLAPQSAGGAIYGRNDWLFYEGDNSVGYYQGTNVLTNAQMRSWMNIYDRLQSICEKKGIKLVVMAAPNKEQAYPEYMPSYNVVTQNKRQNVFLDYMQKNSSVRYLYPLSDLNMAKILYDVFYKQDTHWNAIGGFMGTMAVYRSIGLSTTNILELNVKETKRTGGDLSNFCGYATTYTDYEVEYKTNIQTNVTYYPDNNVGSQVELSQYTSNSSNKSKIVVLGDSFRHSMEGYLSKDFAKATIAHRADFGHYMVQNALRELSSGDVLLLLAVERYDGSNVDMASQLINLWS